MKSLFLTCCVFVGSVIAAPASADVLTVRQSLIEPAYHAINCQNVAGTSLAPMILVAGECDRDELHNCLDRCQNLDDNDEYRICREQCYAFHCPN